MTIQDIRGLLNDISARYPRFSAGQDKERVVDVWAEDLEGYKLEQAQRALIKYAKADSKGYPPTSGQLIALMPAEFEPLDAEDFFAGKVKCPYCKDTGFIFVDEGKVKVCESCRKRLYDILKGAKK